MEFTELTMEQYLVFETRYQKGEYPNQRKGQAFCNEFNVVNPDLFYAKNTEKDKIDSIISSYFK